MKLRYCLMLVNILMCNTLFAEVAQIDADKLKKLMESGVIVIDVRTPGEWRKTGIVEGSLPIMFFNEKRQPLTEQWMQQVSKITTPEDELILICRSGNRSNMIASYLSKQHQYGLVYNVQGGIVDWLAKGNTTVAIK